MSPEHLAGIESREGHENNGEISYRNQLGVVPTGQLWGER